MSTFQRVEDDAPNALTVREDNIQQCRNIAWEVLGDLDEEGLKRTAVHKVRDGEKTHIWGIGHWYVQTQKGRLASNGLSHIDTAWLWRYTQ